MISNENLDLIQLTKAIIQNYPLCDHCLGRQFGNLATGLTNKERGNALKTTLLLQLDNANKTNTSPKYFDDVNSLVKSGHNPAKAVIHNLDVSNTQQAEINQFQSCYLCENILNPEFFEKIAMKIKEATKEIKFATFLVGSVLPGKMLEKEDNLRTEFLLQHAESLKSEFNRELGKHLLLNHFSDLVVDFTTPQLVFIISIDPLDVQIQQSSLFLYGNYKKYQRGIPQSTWHCKNCAGKGCEQCNSTGLMYQTSIQQLVEKPLFGLTGSSESKFHGSGREDIDALMLGTGRPFVIELVNPKNYIIDVKQASELVNEHAAGKIEVDFTELVHKKRVRKLKTSSTSMRKRYRMIADAAEPIELTQKQLDEIGEWFSNQIINQRTPQRVAHRRADLVRKRTVHHMTITKRNSTELEIKIEGEGGLYVKELVSGDGGRTTPSLSEKLGTQIICRELDVISVENPVD
jgi:tRNA pseudouridine synthase 10